MDVVFEITKDKGFTIEIGYFDTVLEIKEKILKYQKIPIARQTLIFNGQVMVDDRDTEYYEVLHQSHIQLVIDPEQDNPNPKPYSNPPSVVKTEVQSPPPPVAPNTKFELLVKIPTYKKQFSLEMDPSSTTIGRLKEKIGEMEPLPMNSRFVVYFNGNELAGDHRSIADYGIPNYGEVSAIIRPLAPPCSTQPMGISNLKKLKLMVLPKCGGPKIQVEVNATDNVGDLRKELLRLQQQQQINFQLPAEGYFFIYKQNVMDDDRSFRWHDVKQGDTIEIFSGSVTGGS